MSKAGWKTHCFGRHLIDLPPDVRVRVRYEIWNDEITWLRGYAPETLRAEVANREAALRGQNHQNGEESMFLRKTAHGTDSVTILSWEAADSRIFNWADSYFAKQNPYRVFKYSGKVSPSKQDSALKFRETLAQSLRSRNENEIPTAAGFCIDGGFIEGKQLMAESFQVTASFSSHPGASLSISAYVQGKVDEPLLKRTGQVAGLLQGFAGMSTLRKRERPIGTLYGEEYLVAGSDQGQRLYAFRWEAPGKANSLAEPAIGVSLSVLAQDEPPPKPPFASDDDALNLWDAIIESIRLRPGAV